MYKAKWRGTEVAVKVMSSEVVTKEMQRQFADEVRSFCLFSCQIWVHRVDALIVAAARCA